MPPIHLTGLSRKRGPLLFLGVQSSPALARQPADGGSTGHFFRTLKDQLLWVRDYTTLEELAAGHEEFRPCYNNDWLLGRLRFRSPQPGRQRLLALWAAA